MEFRQLSYFIAVAETGSISAASRRVHVAQPALTRQVRLLEEDLGTRLLERHARGVSLTVAGQALFEEAVQLLDRRTRIGLVDDDRRRCLPEVERIVSETLAELDA